MNIIQIHEYTIVNTTTTTNCTYLTVSSIATHASVKNLAPTINFAAHTTRLVLCNKFLIEKIFEDRLGQLSDFAYGFVATLKFLK